MSSRLQKKASDKMSDDGANNNRSVRIPTFHKGKWQVFLVKFKAMTAIKGLAEALEPGFKSKLQ